MILLSIDLGVLYWSKEGRVSGRIEPLLSRHSHSNRMYTPACLGFNPPMSLYLIGFRESLFSLDDFHLS